MMTTLTVKEHSKLEEEGKMMCQCTFLSSQSLCTCQFYHRAVDCSSVDIFSCLAKGTSWQMRVTPACPDRSQSHRVWAQQAVPVSGKILITPHIAQPGTGCLIQCCHELLVPRDGKLVRHTKVYWCLQGPDVSIWNRRHFLSGNTE